jgi:hypothetical protein
VHLGFIGIIRGLLLEGVEKVLFRLELLGHVTSETPGVLEAPVKNNEDLGRAREGREIF